MGILHTQKTLLKRIYKLYQRREKVLENLPRVKAFMGDTQPVLVILLAGNHMDLCKPLQGRTAGADSGVSHGCFNVTVLPGLSWACGLNQR